MIGRYLVQKSLDVNGINVSNEYVKLLEKDLKGLHKFLEIQKLHNPVVSALELNPLADIQKKAAQFMHEQRDKIPKSAKG